MSDEQEVKPGMFAAIRSEGDRKDLFSLSEEDLESLEDSVSAAFALEEFSEVEGEDGIKEVDSIEFVE